jgi:nitrate reductase alpha subunit
MIAMGAGTNHWYHSDEIYRTFFTLIMLCGCQGVNGGGWAHYVGQEKVRPLTGFQQVAFALDWQRPPRHMTGTSFFYLNSGQWRYEAFGPGELASPLGRGLFGGRAFADCLAQASRLGWTPSHPAFSRNPLDLADEAAAAGKPVPEYVAGELRGGRLSFAGEDPDDPANWPRVLTVWRANLLGSSGKGMEYFMRHLVGADDAVRASESPPELRPAEVRWREEAPRGKLDLLTAIDFRMTSTCTYADVVLPAATWYEKHDLSSTDMHPFVHSFNPAIAPPWETRTDFDAFSLLAGSFSRLAGAHLGTRTDVVAAPLMHDSPDELAQPGGVVRDWKTGECEPVPGVTMPRLVTVERDYPATAAKMAALGPLTERLGTSVGELPGSRLRPSATCAGRTGRYAAGRATGSRRWPATCIWPRRSWPCRAPPTVRSPWRGGRRWRNAPGSRWPTWPPSGPGSASASPTPRCSRARSSRPRNGPAARPAGGATRRSRSTSSAGSRGTR